VNESHAVAIFRSAVFAENALKTLKHPTIKLRHFSKASEESKEVICSGGSYMISPPNTVSQRPATNTVVAKRLIGNALQIPELQKAKDKDLPKKTKETKQNNYWEE